MSLVVDCDSHVMEPADLWEKWLERRYRDRAIRIERREGVEHLIIGEKSVLSNVLAGLGGAHQDRTKLFTGALSYADGIGAAHEIHGLRALAAFEREPTGARADAVVRTCATLPMSRAALQIVDKAKWGIYSDQPEDFAQDPDERRLPPDLFGDLRQVLGAAVERDVLPGMIEAVRRKDL